MHKLELIKEIEASTSSYIIVPRHILLELLHDKDGHSKNQQEIAKLLQLKNSVLDVENKIDQLNVDSPTLPHDIKAIRKKLKISQFDLAKEARMKQPDVSDFENFKNKTFESERKLRIIRAIRKISSKL